MGTHLYPNRNAASRRFWEGLRERKFLLQRCEECGEVFFPPRILCPECLSERLEHVPARGTGTLYAFTEVWVPMAGFTAPYVLGLVELDEAPGRFLTRIPVPVERLRVGMRVRVVYEDVAEDLTLHRFVPEEEG